MSYECPWSTVYHISCNRWPKNGVWGWLPVQNISVWTYMIAFHLQNQIYVIGALWACTVHTHKNTTPQMDRLFANETDKTWESNLYCSKKVLKVLRTMMVSIAVSQLTCPSIRKALADTKGFPLSTQASFTRYRVGTLSEQSATMSYMLDWVKESNIANKDSHKSNHHKMHKCTISNHICHKCNTNATHN